MKGRFACAAVSLDDGAVLVVGGQNCSAKISKDNGAALSTEILALTEPLAAAKSPDDDDDDATD